LHVLKIIKDLTFYGPVALIPQELIEIQKKYFFDHKSFKVLRGIFLFCKIWKSLKNLQQTKGFTMKFHQTEVIDESAKKRNCVDNKHLFINIIVNHLFTLRLSKKKITLFISLT
jgi:hypothetical protein